MKKIFSLFLIISALISFSCSDNAVGPNDGGGTKSFAYLSASFAF